MAWDADAIVTVITAISSSIILPIIAFLKGRDIGSNADKCSITGRKRKKKNEPIEVKVVDEKKNEQI